MTRFFGVVNNINNVRILGSFLTANRKQSAVKTAQLNINANFHKIIIIYNTLQVFS